MIGTLGVMAALCAGCNDAQDPGGSRLGVLRPTVDVSVSDGCARFQVRFDSGSVPIIEPVYNTAFCAANELKLLSDTAATFNSSTGALRIAVVMENTGTAAVIPRVKLRFTADSVQRYDASGVPLGGASDIIGYQPDSSGTAGRIAFWWYDAYLATPGHPQVLMPGGRTRRRWVEVRGTTWSPRMRLKLFATGQEASAVPSIPPAALPVDFYDDSNIVSNPTLAPDRFVRDVIWISFRPSATSGERLAAIAGVGGTVVGGYRIGASGGSYAVRLPRDPSHLSIFAAERALRANPVVSTATVEFVYDKMTAFRRPIDGPGWTGGDYRVQPESGYAPAPIRLTSALTAINAPMAWGCSTGDSTVAAVLDVGLHTTGLADLTRNVVRTSGVNYAGSADYHGTVVTMLMAARGNDTTLMTGVAWRSRLSLRDITMLRRGVPVITAGRSQGTSVRLKAQLDSAVFEGARVINLSVGRDTTATGVATDTAVYNRGARFAADARGSMDFVPGSALVVDTPLVVIAAGNNPSADPAYSIYPVAKDSIPYHTIVVTAAGHDPGSSLYAPPSGSRVPPDIAAPGEQVFALTSLTQLQGGNGTSYAAPLVSGVALLLLSFDPTLRAREVRTLILTGATRSGRTAGGVPVLDAYASLKLAAERPGAPLCGNRVWLSGTSIKIERGSQVETIPAPIAATDTVYQLDVAHGGRRIDFLVGGSAGYQTQVRSVVWSNGSWQAGPTSPSRNPDIPGSGAGRSLQQRSHDADSVLYLFEGGTAATGVTMIPVLYNGATPLRQATIALPPLADTLDGIEFAGAYPASGAQALVAFNTYDPNTGIPKFAALYRVDLSNPSLRTDTIAVLPNTAIKDIAFSEDGREKIMKLRTGAQACVVTWSRPNVGSAPATWLFDSVSARRSEPLPPAYCHAEYTRGFPFNSGQGTNAPRMAPWIPQGPHRVTTGIRKARGIG